MEKILSVSKNCWQGLFIIKNYNIYFKLKKYCREIKKQSGNFLLSLILSLGNINHLPHGSSKEGGNAYVTE